MKIIDCLTWKGGVGKTSFVVNSAYALAHFWGARTLIVDSDKQGNSTFFFEGHGRATLTNILLDGEPAKYCIQSTRYTPQYFSDRFCRMKRAAPFRDAKIDIIASDIGLMDANLSVLRNQIVRQDNILKTALAEVQEDYDICLIDNPPDMNISVLNALVAADEVILISTSDTYSVQGVYEMVRRIDMDARPFNRDLRLSGILFNKFVPSKNGFAHISELEKMFPVFKQRLRFTLDKLDESTRLRKTIYELSPRCGFAVDLLKFLESYIGAP